MPRRAKDWMVVCDFDGTISTVDVTDELLRKHADSRWLDIEDEWKDGRIGSRECLSRQVALVRAGAGDLDALADTITLDPGFLDFARTCEARGVPLIVVSDGLDQLISRILARYGVGHLPVFANAVVTGDGGQLSLASPHYDPACHAGAGTCKCAVAERLRDELGRQKILFVGDGRSDFCAAQRSADIVAAKSKLLGHLRAQGAAPFAFRDFGDVKRLLLQLIGEPVMTSEENISA